MVARTLISKLPYAVVSGGRSIASRCLLTIPRSSPLLRFRPLLAAVPANHGLLLAAGGLRCFATRATSSSLNDPSPNWSNRPPKETILLDGCDFEHWLVVVDPPDPKLTRDEIIDSYIKTLAQVLGSEEEARMSIYSVSTKHYFAFGAKVSEEISYKIKPLAGVRWVLPDSYLDVKNKDYGGEPFINGQAVPYDPKYHEEWVRNNARANERNRRNDRPRNFDRSRNFERRRENMQNFQNRDAPPMQNQGFQNQNSMPPRDMPPSPSMNSMPPRDMPPSPPMNSMPPRDMPPSPPLNQSSIPRDIPPMPNANSGYQGGPPGGMPGGPVYQGGNNSYQGGSQVYQGGSQGYQGGPSHQGNVGSYQGSYPGYQGGGPGYQGNTGSYQGSGSGYQGGGPGYQEGNPAHQGGGPGYHGGGSYYQGGGSNYQQGPPSYQGTAQGRDLPGRD